MLESLILSGSPTLFLAQNVACQSPTALGDGGVASLYVQLFSLGILWVSVHCSGMCGPIVAGLIHYEIPSTMGSDALGQKIKGVLLYQLGRAMTYGAIGASLGWLGLSIDLQTRQLTRIAGLVAAGVLFVIALHGLLKHKLPALKIPGAERLAASSSLSGLLRRLQRKLPKRGPIRLFFYGMLLGLMPCMLMFWVMHLAIASAHPLHGALLMLGLIFLTTPVLAAAASLTQLRLFGGRYGKVITSLSMMVSSIWIGLVAAAANGWIDHMHTSIMIFGKPYMLMLY